MGAFIFIVIGVMVGIVFCFRFISARTAQLPFLQRRFTGRKRTAFWLCVAFYLAVGAILYLTLNPVNTVIIFIHFGGFWMLSELLFLILRKTTHRQIPGYVPGVIAILFTVGYLVTAWILCTHVWEKDYSLESSRLKGDLRVVQIADSHVGATFHAPKFHDYILEINELHPDIVVITGDFVDDDTTREDLIGSCEALGDLETTYGVFFCYGNHDRGYFNEETRGWNSSDLLENLEKNHVRVLQDESVLIDDSFYVIGRKDKSEEARGGLRLTPAELMEGLDPDLYKIVLDHQPCGYDEEAAAGADLVLSGHSHGGQFFPFNNIGVLTRQYDRSYGYERREGTDFIVTSGISDWSLIFKTGCKSEYVVIDVHGSDGSPSAEEAQ